MAGALGALLAPMPGHPAQADPPECDADPLCADVAVAKKIDDPVDTLPGPVQATWTIAVQNRDANDATSTFVSDVLPAGVVYVGHSMSGPATCTFPSPGSGGSIGCYVDLDKLSSWELSITVETSTAGVYVNEVRSDTVIGKGRTDPDGSNDSASSTWTVQGDGDECLGCDVDVAIDKTFELDPDVSDLIRFHLRIRVGEQGFVPQVVLTDTLEPAFAYLGWSTLEPGRVSCTHDGSPVGGTVTCTALPDAPDPSDTDTWLRPGEFVHVVIEAKIVGGGDCTNAARGTVHAFWGSETGWSLEPITDLDPKNDVSTVSIPLPVGDEREPACRTDQPDDGVRLDASVAKEIVPELNSDDERTFNIAVTNTGVDPIPFVVVGDVLPERLEYVSVEAPEGVDCTFTDDTTPGGGELRCRAPSTSDPEDPGTWLQPGDSVKLLVRTRLAPTGSGCENVAVVETYRFTPSADKQNLLGYVEDRFADDEPQNNVSSAAVGGPDDSCGGPGDGGPGGGGPGGGGPGGSTPPDDGEDPAPEEPSEWPVLQLDKQVDATEILVGEELTYRLVYRNVGDAAATDVTVTDDVPDGLAIVAVSDGCSVEGQHVTCVDPVLPPGVERAFLVTVVPTFEGRFVNEARVTSREGDPEVDDDPEAPGSPSDRVTVEVRRSTTPDPSTPGTSTGTDRLPTTGWSPRLGVLAASLAALGAGLVLLAGGSSPVRTAEVPVHGASWRRRRDPS
jgi:uncharacterized repeat protein (TIGR01451 family)